MFDYFDMNNDTIYMHDSHGDVRAVDPTKQVMDFGPHPFVVDIKKATENNNNFRTALWTGNHLQTTLMNIPVGEDIGAEMHPHVDQFLRVEDGSGITMMGKSKEQMDYRQPIFNDSAIFVPAGTWHNIVNTGNSPLKLYSIYAPANHPWGTVHKTKEEAEMMENHN